MNTTFQLPEGLLGFEEIKELTLIPVDVPFDATFYELRSPEEGIGFIAVDPFKIESNYAVALDEDTLEKLEVEASEDVIVLSLVTLKKSLDTSTTNLKAPLVFNLRNKKAMQWVHTSTDFSVKHPLKGDA